MNVIFDLPEIRAHVHVWPVVEYEKLGDDPAFRRTELIRGIIVNKRSRTPRHFELTTTIYDFFHHRVNEGWTVRQEGPLRLADSMPEPDVAVVRGARQDFRTRPPTTAALVVEIAVTSLALDREKATLYAEAGVGEYWIVLAEAEQVEVYRQPVDGVYQTKRTYERGESIEGVGVTAQAVAVDTLFA